MSRGVNKVILIGNLGADPETRNFDDGGMVANISLATSQAWKDKNTGEPREHTEWHRVVFRNRLAEIVAQYLAKGSRIYIEGSLRTRKWQAQDGQDRYTTEVNAKEMQMLDSRGQGDSQGQGYQRQPQQHRPQGGNGQGYQRQPPNQGYQGHQGQGYQPPAPEFDDDIPF